jgi:uncharacterized membrane protein
MNTVAQSWSQANVGSMAATGPATSLAARLQSIDALRGLVMVIMLLDHVRENWFLHHQVADPVDALTVDPGLFFTRLTSTLCAPIFVALTGLGAYLYGQHHTPRETSIYLVKRGLFLMLIDILVITPLWTVKMPPTIWLQVIWCIGICMIVLAALIHVKRSVLLALGLIIVCGHNLLSEIRLTPDHALYIPWAMLYQRALIDLPFGATARTSYPVLAWIGVILLGYVLGPWFDRAADAVVRQRRLILLGSGMLVAFVLLRALNVYGDKPWFDAGSALRTTMSFLALTKYPPSLLFLLSTLGVGALLLAWFERVNQDAPWLRALGVFGAAPMFFYILHMAMLRVLYHIAYQVWGPNHGAFFGVDSLVWVWVWYLALIVPFYIPTAAYARLKARRKDIAWLKYL